MPDAAQPEVGTPARTLLESRYRAWLRLLPADYRLRWEDDMVDTFLAGTLRGDEEAVEIAGYGKPSPAEVTSIAGLAVRLRFGGLERGPRPKVWWDAWRLIAMVGLLVNTVWSSAFLVVSLWLAGGLPGIPVHLGERIELAGVTDAGFYWSGDWWLWWGNLAGIAWAGALVALLHRRRRTALVLSLIAVAPAVRFQVRFPLGPEVIDLASVVSLLVDLLPVVAMVAFVHGTVEVRRSRWLWSWLAGTAVLSGVDAAGWGRVSTVLLDRPGLNCAALAIGAAGYVGWLATRGADADPRWSLALAILAVVVLVQRLATLSFYWPSDLDTDHTQVLVARSGVVEAVLAAAAALTFATLSTRAIRRLPATVTG